MLTGVSTYVFGDLICCVIFAVVRPNIGCGAGSLFLFVFGLGLFWWCLFCCLVLFVWLSTLALLFKDLGS